MVKNYVGRRWQSIVEEAFLDDFSLLLVVVVDL